MGSLKSFPFFCFLLKATIFIYDIQKQNNKIYNF